MTPSTITYRTGNDLDLDAVIESDVASTLGQRRPVDDRQCMARMIVEANLVVTAWDGDLLVGISRSLTDFCYICYLADLAVPAVAPAAGGRRGADTTDTGGARSAGAHHPAGRTRRRRLLSAHRFHASSAGVDDRRTRRVAEAV